MTATTKVPSPWRRMPHDPTDWFSREQIDRARLYQKPLSRLRALRLGLQLVVVLVFAFSEAGPRLAERVGADGWIQELLVIAIALELVGVLYDLSLIHI